MFADIIYMGLYFPFRYAGCLCGEMSISGSLGSNRYTRFRLFDRARVFVAVVLVNPWLNHRFPRDRGLIGYLEIRADPTPRYCASFISHCLLCFVRLFTLVFRRKCTRLSSFARFNRRKFLFRHRRSSVLGSEGQFFKQTAVEAPRH